MTDTVLQSLRARVLDESEPIAGLLRKCLVLGAETGSSALRDWARRELNGYGDDTPVPDYRAIGTTVILYDGIGGTSYAKGLSIHPLQLPTKAQEHLPKSIELRQPVEELERLAKDNTISFSTGALAYAEMLWNRELGAFQNVVNLRYAFSGSLLAGVVGQVRTNLVEIVADLTVDNPLAELPPTTRVDEALRERVGQVGDVYNTHINQSDGPIAVGKRATAKTEGVSVADLKEMLAEVQRTIEAIPPGEDRSEAESSLLELRSTVEQQEPETGEVVRKTGRLHQAVSKLGSTAATVATTRVTEAITNLAMSGQFL